MRSTSQLVNENMHKDGDYLASGNFTVLARHFIVNQSIICMDSPPISVQVGI